jgi:methylmalonyl-CoA/ethylmalonyl-CoA epimerase
MKVKGILDTNIVIQAAIIVKDIEATKEKWAAFLGLPVPPTVSAGEYKVTQTRYNGAPAPEASCLLAFLEAGANMTIELIQPNGTPSVWQEHLDQKGESLHHIAFGVQGMDEKIAACEKSGMKLVQRGNFGGGDGRYADMDANEDLKTVIELLESY